MFRDVKDTYFEWLIEMEDYTNLKTINIVVALIMFLEDKILDEEDGEYDYLELEKQYNFFERVNKAVLNSAFCGSVLKMVGNIRNRRTVDEFYDLVDEIGEDIYININNDLQNEDQYINKDICTILSFEILRNSEINPFINKSVLKEFEESVNIFEGRMEGDYLKNDKPLFFNMQMRKEFYSLLSSKEKKKFDELVRYSEECFFNGEKFTAKISKEDRKFINSAELFILSYAAHNTKVDYLKDALGESVKAFEDNLIKLYDIAIKEIEEFELIFAEMVQDKINEEIPNINSSNELNNYIIKTSDELIENVFKNLKKSNKSIKKIECLTDAHIKTVNIMHSRFKKYNKKVEYSRALLQAKHCKDMSMFWIMSILNKIKSLITFYLDYFKETVKENFADIDLKDNKSHIEIEDCKEKTVEKKFNTITNYRKLNQLANSNGFEKIRQNGDHGIFQRFDGSTIVIPQGRAIGKGLSLKIQKELCK